MNTGMKLFLSSALLVLASCASPKPKPAPALPPAPQTMKPIPNPAPKPQPHAENQDQCGAKSLQYLVGKPRIEIPIPLDPSKRRVVCSTCAVTMDYRSDRQTITFDVNTGIIQSVKCG